MSTSIDQLVSTYGDQNQCSQELILRAQTSLPGRNTRTVVYLDPFPIYSKSGAGVYVTDVDGNERLDFVNNATALILGHAHPSVVGALQDRTAQGTAFYGPTELEIKLAELLRARLPSLERLRFCSSGTEAVLNVIRVARAFTSKSKIAKFEGAYHGIDDPAMISYLPPLGPELGPQDSPRSVLSSKGLAPGTAESVVVLPFNDPEACARILLPSSSIRYPRRRGSPFPVPGFSNPCGMSPRPWASCSSSMKSCPFDCPPVGRRAPTASGPT